MVNGEKMFCVKFVRRILLVRRYKEAAIIKGSWSLPQGNGRLFETMAAGSGFGPSESPCAGRLPHRGGAPDITEDMPT